MTNRVPEVSVCICSRDRAQDLAETLTALGAALPPHDGSVEIITVDNGSSDGTAAAIHDASRRDSRIRYVYEPFPGVNRARNTALRHARGEILVFIDDDVRPEAGWFEAIIRPIRLNQADAVAGKVQLPDHLNPSWMTPLLRLSHAESPGLGHEGPPVIISANMAFSRRLARSVPFDEELGPGQLGMADDVLFYLQVQTAGFRIAAANNAVVVHQFHESRLHRAEILALARKNGRSHAYIWRHWLHSEIGWLPLRLLDAWRRWFIARLRQGSGGGVTDGAYDAAFRIEFFRGLRIERRRAPRYPSPDERRIIIRTAEIDANDSDDRE
jgi:glycosyltransferase involved in cell wall biosynthesis